MMYSIKNADVWTVSECVDEFDCCETDLKKSGVYRFLSGCRGVLEEVEYLGDVDEVQVKSREECLELNREWFEDCCDDELSEEELMEINDEYYHLEMIEGCRLNGKNYLINGWTEEDSDCFVRVAVQI